MENNYMEIEYMDKKVKLLQYQSESTNQFNKRIEYIKKIEKKNIDWKEANRLSKIWYSIKAFGCKYPPEIYHRVISFDK